MAATTAGLPAFLDRSNLTAFASATVPGTVFVALNANGDAEDALTMYATPAALRTFAERLLAVAEEASKDLEDHLRNAIMEVTDR